MLSLGFHDAVAQLFRMGLNSTKLASQAASDGTASACRWVSAGLPSDQSTGSRQRSGTHPTERVRQHPGGLPRSVRESVSEPRRDDFIPARGECWSGYRGFQREPVRNGYEDVSSGVMKRRHPRRNGKRGARDRRTRIGCEVRRIVLRSMDWAERKKPLRAGE